MTGKNLNGLWKYAITPKGTPAPAAYQGDILVPFAVESSLSGVGKMINEKEELWYQRTFDVPSAWRGKQILLHFGAVDWKAEVWVNDVKSRRTHRRILLLSISILLLYLIKEIMTW